VVSNKVVIWHWEHSSNPILDAVFIIDSIVSTEHSISNAREIFETLRFAISLDFGRFVHLRFRHAIEVFIWIRMWIHLITVVKEQLIIASILNNVRAELCSSLTPSSFAGIFLSSLLSSNFPGNFLSSSSSSV
jgi:hypothetical protein